MTFMKAGLWIPLVILGFVSCQEKNVDGPNGSGGGDENKQIEPSGRGRARAKAREIRSRPSRVEGLDRKLARLAEMRAEREKRDLFAEILMELPPDEHDLAVLAVIDDLKSPAPANLVSEYLEMSAFLSPALQLPGMVRLLEEPELPRLQRIVMEQQLREELQIGPGVEVSDWRPLVEDHLKQLPGVISE
jgi:hypothetical protein